MAVTAAATGTQTAVLTTEHLLASVAVAGVYQLVVDRNAMLAGDVLELRAKQMTLTSGTTRVVYFFAWYGVVDADDAIAVSLPISNELTDATAVQFTLTQTFGTGRAYPWKILKVG